MGKKLTIANRVRPSFVHLLAFRLQVSKLWNRSNTRLLRKYLIHLQEILVSYWFLDDELFLFHAIKSSIASVQLNLNWPSSENFIYLKKLGNDRNYFENFQSFCATFGKSSENHLKSSRNRLRRKFEIFLKSS